MHNNDKHSDLLTKIDSCTGMAHLNRSRARSFSVNIFRLNAQELIEITRRISDADEGIRLMSVDNREAGDQTHREVTRRVHNFAAAAKTLVEHTRIFMREHYGSSEIIGTYQNRVDKDFKNDPLSQFIEDLRDYMMHKGLPPSHMFLNFESNPDAPDGQGSLTTGINIETDKLKTWRGWSKEGRAFIDAAGESIDIQEVAVAYSNKVNAFQSWLQNELDVLHKPDVNELQELQRLLQQRAPIPLDSDGSNGTEASGNPTRSEEDDSQLGFGAQADDIDVAASALLKKIRHVDVPPSRTRSFVSERPTGPTITPADMKSAPVFWGTDVDGRRVLVFIYKDGAPYGLDESAFAEIELLITSILKPGWAHRELSRDFVKEVIVSWMQTAFLNLSQSKLTAAIQDASRASVALREFWAPIAYVEVGSVIPMGEVSLAPITRDMLDRLERKFIDARPDDSEQVTQLLDRIRKSMQGLAAVVLKMRGEPKKIEQDGYALAVVVSAFLGFMSPAAANFPAISACALLGTDVIPQSHLLVLGEESFHYSQSVLSPNIPNWQISESEFNRIRPNLDAIGPLIRSDGLHPFALAVRSSILMFSAGARTSNHIERLTYTILSIEALLLKHSAEPIEFNIEERMTKLLVAKVEMDQDEVRRCIRDAYRIRARQDISPLTPHDAMAVAKFIRNAYLVLCLALSSTNNFDVVARFVAVIEALAK